MLSVLTFLTSAYKSVSQSLSNNQESESNNGWDEINDDDNNNFKFIIIKWKIISVKEKEKNIRKGEIVEILYYTMSWVKSSQVSEWKMMRWVRNKNEIDEYTLIIWHGIAHTYTHTHTHTHTPSCTLPQHDVLFVKETSQNWHCTSQILGSKAPQACWSNAAATWMRESQSSGWMERYEFHENHLLGT